MHIPQTHQYWKQITSFVYLISFILIGGFISALGPAVPVLG